LGLVDAEDVKEDERADERRRGCAHPHDFVEAVAPPLRKPARSSVSTAGKSSAKRLENAEMSAVI
jgi:hypothetical protein